MILLTGISLGMTRAASRACENTWESMNLAGNNSAKFCNGTFFVSGLQYELIGYLKFYT